MRAGRLWWWIWLLALGLAYGAAGSGQAVEPANVSVDVRRSLVRISTDAARVDVRWSRVRLRVRDLSERRIVLRERRGGGLFYERGGTVYGLGKVTDVEVLVDGARLVVDTDEGPSARLTLRFLTQRTLQVDLEPPQAGSLDRRGETVEMRILPTFSLYAPFYP